MAPWRAAVRAHRWLIWSVALYVSAGYLAEAMGGIEGMMRPLWHAETFLLFYGVAAYSAVVVLAALRWRARDGGGGRLPSRESWQLARRRFRALIVSERGIGALLVIGLLPLFMNAFGCWKSAIPYLQPFGWDAALAQADRVLHGGTDPWRLLRPLLERPWVVLGWDYGYTLFIPVQTAFVLWQVWSGEAAARQRFLRSYVVAWVLLGTVGAIAFASGGPCFYGGLVAGPDPFEPLFRTLRDTGAVHPLGALEAQQILWESFRRHLAIPFAGISAMPSMHVALPMLFVLAAWRVDRRLRLACLLYLAFNLVGSVLLGWHYAIDGYVAMLGMALIWIAVGRWGGAHTVAPAYQPAR